MCIRVFIEHLCKTFRHNPLPLPLTPSPIHRANLGCQRPKEYFKAASISQNDQIDRSPISRARYLYRVSTECRQIFNVGKGRNCLGGKPPKFAIYEIPSPETLLSEVCLLNNLLLDSMN